MGFLFCTLTPRTPTDLRPTATSPFIRTPITVLPLDMDISWDCTNTSAYSFSGVNQPDGAPFHYANVLAHQVVSIPPGSPFAATNMWKGNCIPGQLTSVGAMQHRGLGAALRQIYVGQFKLLPPTYDPEIVQIRSTGMVLIVVSLG